MRQSIGILDLTVQAATALSQYLGVDFGGNAAITQGQKILGIALYNGNIGDEVPVRASGTALVIAGAPIAVGQSLIMNALGQAIPSTGALNVKAGATAVTSTAANGAILAGGDLPEYVFADALEAATAAGQIIEVFMRGH